MPGNVIVDNADYGLATWNNVFIAVYRSGVTSDSVAREEQALSDFIEETPGKTTTDGSFS